MSKKKLNILLLGLNAILLLLFLIPFGEPPTLFQFLGRLHPLILHFPIVLLIVAFVFEILDRRDNGTEFKKPAEIMLWSGALLAVVTAIAGNLLSLNGEYSGSSFLFHKWFGLATSIVAAGLTYLNQRPNSHKVFMPAYGMLVILLVVTGHFGATLTHGEGFLTDVFVQDQTLALKSEEPVFTQVISPILDSKCTSCHNTSKLKGGLLLDSEEGILKGGESGAVIVPGDINESSLTHNVLLPAQDKTHMPPKGKPQLSNEEVKMLTWWVESGASFSQTVGEIANDDEIQVTLASYFAPEEKINVDFVSSELIESLNTDKIKVRQITTDLPFIDVNIGQHSNLTVDEIRGLRKIKDQIYSMDLGNSHVDKNILREVARFKNLHRLYLDNTKADDEMLSVLRKVKKLEYLNLYSTQITEKGAAKVADMPSLTQLFLWQTDIEPSAITALQAKHPNVEINGGLAQDSDFTRSQLVPPKMLFSSTFFEDQMIVEVNYSLSETDLFYQLDAEAPQLVEDGKIELNRSVKVTLTAQKSGWEDSAPVEQVFIKVAKNQIKKTVLKHNPKGEYLGKGVASLFDLDKGSENFRDGKWLGFNGDDLIVDIELEKAKTINTVFISTMDDLGSWIFPSPNLEVWGGKSVDQLVKLSDLKFTAPEGPEPKHMKIHQLQFAPQELKYLQIRAKNHGILPDWHPGKGNTAWLFVDEIAFQ